MDSSEVGAYWEGNAEAWIRLTRAGYDVYRDALNTPAFLAMLPPIEGLVGLDVGCGEGTNTRSLARRGAFMTAIDIAPSFISAARAAEAVDPLGIDFLVGDAAELSFAEGSFAFATAFMSLMDMPRQDAVLDEVHRVLRDDGFLQFSILHPCFAPPHRKVLRDANGKAYALELADYFWRTEGDVATWTFGAAPADEHSPLRPFQVPRFHRTLTDWITMILASGFALEAVGEPTADEEAVRRVPGIDDTCIAPLFLHVRARKTPKPERRPHIRP